MFELYDVDISNINGHANYVVESDAKNVSEGYGGSWKPFGCSEDEIEMV